MNTREPESGAHDALQPWALVTGGAVRVGARICHALAQDGWAIAIHHHESVGAGAELAQRLRESHGARTMTVAADLSRADGVETLFAALDECLVRPTAVVNNAAIFPRRPIDAIDASHAERTFAINTVAPMLVTRSAVGRGELRAVVNVLDARYDRPWPGRSIYVASKAALASFTRSAADELAPRVRVNGVALGPTMLPPATSAELRDAILEKCPTGTLTDPDEAARLVALLCTEQTQSVTGAIWHVDGGRHLR